MHVAFEQHYTHICCGFEDGDFYLELKIPIGKRYVEGAVEIIYNTLKKAETFAMMRSDKPGLCGPYVQSERRN